MEASCRVNWRSELRAGARELPSSDPTAWGEGSRKMVTAQLNPVGVGIHSVLIATDFSCYSKVALNSGLELAHRIPSQGLCSVRFAE